MAAIHSWKHKRAGDFWAKYDNVFHPVPPLPNIKCARHSVLVSTQQRGQTTNLTISPLLIFYYSSGEPKPLVGREGIFARLMKNLIFCDNGVTFMTIWWPFLTIWWQFLTILRQFLTILWQFLTIYIDNDTLRFPFLADRLQTMQHLISNRSPKQNFAKSCKIFRKLLLEKVMSAFGEQVLIHPDH